MDDKYKIISHVIDNLRQAFQILNIQFNKVEKETGLTGHQLWAIMTINNNSPVKVSDLINKLYLNPTTVIGIIDRLEKQDLIKRRRSKDDRRVVWIELTTKGHQLVKSAPEVAQGLLVSGLEEISVNTLTKVERSIQLLLKIFDTEKISPISKTVNSDHV